MATKSLLTYKDISEGTGISVGALRKRLSTGTMPLPDLRHGSSPVWYAETLADWYPKAGPGDRNHAKKSGEN
jgi:hypothetical protein